MKTTIQISLIVTALLIGGVVVTAQTTTAFTYQGQLSINGAPANGSFDFQFLLADAAVGGNQVGLTQSAFATPVSNGLFAVQLDFGANPFSGPPRWLEAQVRTNNSLQSFVILSPLQRITASPYAITANSASNLLGYVLASQLSGSIPVANLSSNVALLNASQTFTGSESFNGPLTISSTVHAHALIFMNVNDILLGQDNDYSHGLGWYGGGKLFAGNNVNGPVLYGNSGGALGYTGNGTNLALSWNTSGNVAIDPAGLNTGTLLPGLTFGAGSGEGISSQRTAGANQFGLNFYTAFNPRMTIANTGNVGIGTTNPSSALAVNGTVTATAFVGNGAGLTGLSAPTLGSITGGQVGFLSDYGITIASPGSASTFIYPLMVYSSSNSGTVIDWRNSTGDLGKLGQSFGGGWMGLYNSSGTLTAAIGTQPNDVTYFNGGNVGIGTTTPGTYKLYVAGSAYCTAGTWSGSDARWKRNVQPVTHALEKVTRLQGVTYDWRREEFPERNFDGGTQLGFLAQDVEKVVPEAVRTDTQGYKAVAYEKLTAVLTEGVKEQQTEINSLKAQNAELEKDVKELKALVNKLLAK